MTKHESAAMTYSSKESLRAREALFKLLIEYSATTDERERSLGLFVRGSLLARFLAIADVYKLIVEKPGIIMDIGTWRGQTAVLCENLRAIYEPLHLNRRIVCFDTFTGYKGFGENDEPTKIHRNGTYKVGESYARYLRKLLEVHERNNAMGHNFGKHSVISGDCRKTIPDFFNNQRNEFVALAFFDVNSYEPTLEAFDAIYKRTIPAGVMAFWQLTRKGISAEGSVYSEKIINKYSHTIHRCATYPGLCYFIKG